MLLKEFCTTDVLFCSRDTTVIEAAEIMRRKHTGDLVVVDDPTGACLPVGIVTDRDLVVKVLGTALNAASTTLGQIMRTPLVTAEETEDTTIAIARMRAHGVRRLPITGRRGELVGIVTLDDLLRRLGTEVTALIDIVAKEQDHERRNSR